MYLATSSNDRLVLEGEHLPGWAVWLLFGGIFAVIAISSAWGGDLKRLLIGLLCGGTLLVGIPFVVFATSKYPRLEIERDKGIRKYHVSRLSGAHVEIDLPWDDIRRVVAQPEMRTIHGDGGSETFYQLALNVEKGEESIRLGLFEGGRRALQREWLAEPIRLLQHQLGDKLMVVEGEPRLCQ